MSLPNVLFVMTDQQRWDSAGCYGTTCIETPALDSLARDGARFDRCYCTNPICTPSRASIWTGRHLPGHGVYRLDDILGSDQVLFSEYLKEAGYKTGLFGKLHVSGRMYENDNRHPHDGFDEYEWALEGPLDMDAPHHAYAKWLEQQDPEVSAKMREQGRDLLHIPRHLHFTHWACERGRDFIRRRASDPDPFFCCISVFDPHNPYEDYPEEYRARVDVSKLPPVLDDTRIDVPAEVERERQGSYLGDINKFSAKDIEEMRIGYYASIALFDDELGETLKLLDELGITDNTLVIFVSDHGDMLGDHRMLVKGAMFYDACTRIPFLMRWPGQVPAGTVVNAPVQPHDIAATVLSAAGLSLSDKLPEAAAAPELVAQDLLPVVAQAAATAGPDAAASPAAASPAADGDGVTPEVGRDVAVCLYRNTGINRITRDWDPPIHGSMIFDGRYKLSLFHGPGAADKGTGAADNGSGAGGDNGEPAPGVGSSAVSEGRPRGELYDMDSDPDELHNLWRSAEFQEVRSRLTMRLLNWLAGADISYLGSRGGTAVVTPDRFVANTIDKSRGERHG